MGSGFVDGVAGVAGGFELEGGVFDVEMAGQAALQLVKQIAPVRVLCYCVAVGVVFGCVPCRVVGVLGTHWPLAFRAGAMLAGAVRSG